MSKEQTPMHELRANIERSEVMPEKMKAVLLSFDWETLYKREQQHTKAKVLEALEREVPKACIETSNNLEGTYLSNHSVHKYAKDYYETEVKPKYE